MSLSLLGTLPFNSSPVGSPFSCPSSIVTPTHLPQNCRFIFLSHVFPSPPNLDFLSQLSGFLLWSFPNCLPTLSFYYLLVLGTLPSHQIKLIFLSPALSPAYSPNTNLHIFCLCANNTPIPIQATLFPSLVFPVLIAPSVSTRIISRQVTS